MTVRDAMTEEFDPFLTEEGKFLDDQAKALNNTGVAGFRWYKQGPATNHGFKRTELDREVSRTTVAPERIAKNAADMIANCERASKARYDLTRLDMFVRGRVRMNMLKFAGVAFKEHLDEEVG